MNWIQQTTRNGNVYYEANPTPKIGLLILTRPNSYQWSISTVDKTIAYGKCQQLSTAMNQAESTYNKLVKNIQ